MTKFNFLLISLVMILLSCSKYTDYMPDLPENLSADINDDGIIDYEIEYKYVDIESTEGDFGIVGLLDPIGENQILIDENSMSIFLNNLDDLEIQPIVPFIWSTKGFSEDLISITNNHEGRWPNKWHIDAASHHNYYLVGLKLNQENGETLLGWIELNIDRSNGQMEITDKGIIQ